METIPIAKPLLGENEAEAARRVIMSGWVTQGPEVAAFEKAFADYVGAPHACAVSNCTTALHLALLALGVGAGDEIVTVSHSFIATANAVLYCGATPVFVDIEPHGYNIDVEQIEGAITRHTRAILCVHQLGMPCNMARIMEIAHRFGLPVIEDAACAVGSQIQWDNAWQHVGAPIADIACFSFHPRKVATTGDGGMLTTANPVFDRQFRTWRQHGMSVPDTVRHGSSQVIFETYPEVGFNYRMTDLQAAVGREQLKRLPEIVTARRRLAQLYTDRLKHVAGLQLPIEPAWARSNWQSYCVRLPDWFEQREVMQKLLDRGIATRRAVMNAHLEPPYMEAQSGRMAVALPRSEAAQQHGIMLPLFAQMTDDELDRVVVTFEAIVGNSAMVSA